MSAPDLAQLLTAKRVIVVCGAGGVGKTTSAASLAVAAARAGRRVLVITIDPSKRLAQTLGVSAQELEPVALSLERQQAVGIAAPGDLSAWMLDPQAVSDQTVRRLATDDASAELLLRNRVYRHVTSMIAGMQEYTAVEALHEFIRDDRYDLVVLDTPPSRDNSSCRAPRTRSSRRRHACSSACSISPSGPVRAPSCSNSSGSSSKCSCT
jgi:anion-transporting  ArsA/GET3 family ATPase